MKKSVVNKDVIYAKIERLHQKINDLEYQLETANKEIERLAPYANIPTPPLSAKQRAVFDVTFPLPPIRLR